MLIQLSKGKFAIIDDEDFELVSQYKWYTSYYGYAVASYKDTKIFLHRLIMKPSKGMFVDHANHDTLDNRKTNLRICTRRENQSNMSLRKDNTSGVKGVRWHKQLKKWNARIHVAGKEISLGCYHDLNDATKAYNQAAVKYHGEFANLNPIKV